MFSFNVPAFQHTGVTLTSSTAGIAAPLRILNYRNVFFNVLIIISLCCNIIVSAPQAVAFALTPSDSLMMFQPQVNSSGIALSQRKEFSKSPEKLDVLLTPPGQQVINAVPVNERGDFIMYHLAIALQEMETVAATGALQSKLYKDLSKVIRHYGKKLTNLKNVPIYGKFSTELLQWIEAEFNLTHRNVYKQLRSRSQLLCNSEGVCYSSPDIGCLCCPF